MSYLERNSRMLTEVGANASLKRRHRKTSGSTMDFSPVGRYKSPELGLNVYVGIKEFRSPVYNEFRLKERLIKELAIMTVIAQNMPHLLPELPLFYGLLLDKNGHPIAIVTEDLSKNGKVPVDAYSDFDADDIKPLFAPLSVNEDHLSRVPISVKGKRRLVDFDPLIKRWMLEEHRERFPEKEIEEQLDQHTLKLSYDL